MPSRRWWMSLIAALVVWAPILPAVAGAMPAGPPPGHARIWIYRLDEPYVSLARPYVRFNDRIVGISDPGGAFYRDVLPGRYRVTVDSQGRDVNQFARIDLAAGQQAYIEVQVLRDWDCSTSDHDRCWPTFYARLEPPQHAVAAIARSTLDNGS
jgi:hypothetical protein